MDLPSNLPDLLNTKVAERVYDDGLSPPVKEVGSMGVDLVKSLRLFTAPFQLLAAYQDRLAAFCDRVRQQVPPERQVEAPANVAGPVFETLRYVEDGSVVQELMFNLMAKAIDRDRQADAHPAYSKIIAELSTSDAFLLFDLAQKRIMSEKVEGQILEPTEHVFRLHFPDYNHLSREALYACLDHFQALGLLNHSENKTFSDWNEMAPAWQVYIGINHFGEQFLKVCLPNKRRVEALRAEWGAAGK